MKKERAKNKNKKRKERKKNKKKMKSFGNKWPEAVVVMQYSSSSSFSPLLL